MLGVDRIARLRLDARAVLERNEWNPLALTFDQHGHFFSVVLALAMQLFGDSFVAVRTASAIIGSATVLLLYVATLARQTGGDEFAHHIVRQRAQPYLLALYRQAQHTQRHEPFIPPYLELLIDLDPQGALRVLRQTRPKGVQQDEDERDSMRIDYLAKAHQALGRPVRSERLRAHLAS